MAQVKKLSIATVFGKIDLEALIKAPEQAQKCMRVIGRAVGVKEGMSSFGDWKALQGQFQATNLATGEVFEAATLFLPDVAMTPLLVALSTEGSRGVEFAIDVSVKYVKNGKPGGVPYEYTWEPLLPPDASDPIARLSARLVELGKLPAPDAKPADAAGSGKPADAAGNGKRKN